MELMSYTKYLFLHLVFFVLSASETGLLLVVKLKRNVVMIRAGVKIMHQSNARRP